MIKWYSISNTFYNTHQDHQDSLTLGVQSPNFYFIPTCLKIRILAASSAAASWAISIRDAQCKNRRKFVCKPNFRQYGEKER